MFVLLQQVEDYNSVPVKVSKDKAKLELYLDEITRVSEEYIRRQEIARNKHFKEWKEFYQKNRESKAFYMDSGCWPGRSDEWLQERLTTMLGFLIYNPNWLKPHWYKPGPITDDATLLGLCIDKSKLVIKELPQYEFTEKLPSPYILKNEFSIEEAEEI